MPTSCAANRPTPALNPPATASPMVATNGAASPSRLGAKPAALPASGPRRSACSGDRNARSGAVTARPHPWVHRAVSTKSATSKTISDDNRMLIAQCSPGSALGEGGRPPSRAGLVQATTASVATSAPTLSHCIHHIGAVSRSAVLPPRPVSRGHAVAPTLSATTASWNASSTRQVMRRYVCARYWTGGPSVSAPSPEDHAMTWQARRRFTESSGLQKFFSASGIRSLVTAGSGGAPWCSAAA